MFINKNVFVSVFFVLSHIQTETDRQTHRETQTEISHVYTKKSLLLLFFVLSHIQTERERETETERDRGTHNQTPSQANTHVNTLLVREPFLKTNLQNQSRHKHETKHVHTTK